MNNDKPKVACPHCSQLIPEGSAICPLCGKKIRPRLGSLTDEQIRKIKRPLSIIAWVAVAIVIYVKYFT